MKTIAAHGRALTRYAFAAALATVSTAALVLTLVELVPEGPARWLAVVAGISLQASLYVFSRGNRIERLMSGVLFFVSVLATAGYAEYAWQTQQAEQDRKRTEQSAKSESATLLRQQIDDADRELQRLQQLATTDATNGYRQRVIREINPQITKLQERRFTLFQQLQQTLKQAETTAPASMADATLSRAPELLRFVAWLFLAGIIDLCALLGFRKQQPLVAPVVSEVETTPATAETKPETTATVLETEPQDKCQLTPIIKKIRQGDYGHQPVSVRNLLAGEGIRHNDWQQIKSRMLDAGELIQKGRQFEYQSKQMTH